MRRLALTFAVASLGPILVLGWLVSAATRDSIEGRSTQLYGGTSSALVRLVAASLFIPEDFAPGASMAPERTATVDTFLERLAVDPGDVRVVVVARSGRVVYSNYGRAAGSFLPLQGGLERALAGETTTDIVDADSSVTRPSLPGTPVETAIPIRFHQTRPDTVGALVASGLDPAFIDRVNGDITRLRRLLAVGLAVLWLSLLPIMFSVSRRLRRQSRANEYLARHDTLTTLPNRNLLHERLRTAIEAADRTATRVGLLLIDLDRFKEVNDTLGHRAGDELLRHVADRLRQGTRDDDTVARLGGDEFAIVVADADDRDGIVEVVDRVTRSLQEPLLIDGIDIAVEASIGVAVYPVDASSAASLLQHADIAMYTAKASGRPYSFYDAALDANSPSRLELAAELRRALAGDRDQVVLHYQPVATSVDGRVVSMEALVRWHHPERGLLAPEAFIPLAEQSGLISQLTRHVLELAVAQATCWRGAGSDVSVAVNLSARDMHDVTISEHVGTVLARHGLPPGRLELELTETAVLGSPESAFQLAAQLRATGVGIALDDFGTGYSSLTYLKRLRPDRLKIDRGFVATMADDPTDAAIVQSVVHLAHGLRIGVTAEGVETRAQWDLLEGLGCDLVQGYFLSPPMPVDQATAWLATRAVPTPG